MIEPPDHLLLPIAPSLVACAHPVGQRDHHQRVEHVGVPDHFGKFRDGGGILHIPGPRHGAHFAVIGDQGDEHLLTGWRELETSCDSLGRESAGLFVPLCIGGFARVMQEHREIKHPGVPDMAEDLPIARKLRVFREEKFIDLLDTSKRVLVGRVAVKELMLHETGQRLELGEVFSEEAEVVHEPQDPADLPLC